MLSRQEMCVKKLKKVKIEINVGYVVWKHFWAGRLAEFELKDASTRDTTYYRIDTMTNVQKVFTYHEREAWCYVEGEIFSSIGIKLNIGFDIGYMNIDDLHRVSETGNLQCTLDQYKATFPRVRYNRKSEVMIILFPRMTLFNGTLNVAMSLLFILFYK